MMRQTILKQIAMALVLGQAMLWAQTPDATAIPDAQKKRVIVDQFEFSAVPTKEDQVFGTNANVGKAIRSLFITRITQGGKMVPVERQKLATLTAEQDRNQSSSTAQGKGAQSGRLIGADVILTGDIVVYGRDDSRKRVTGGGVIGGALGGFIKRGDTNKFVIVINYRLVDAESGEVIQTGEARGEAERKNKQKGGVLGGMLRGAGSAVVGVEVSENTSNFDQTIVGEATQDCVTKLMPILDEKVSALKRRVREVETTVVDITGATLTIGAGANAGVNVGEIFEIHHIIKTLIDPVTKEVLDRQTEKIGEMTVSAVRPNVASGSYSASAVQATADFMAIKKIPAQQ